MICSLFCLVLTVWGSMQILSEEKLKGLSELVHHHSQHRAHIINLLDEGYSHLKSITDAVEEKIKQFEVNREQQLISPQTDTVLRESECRDVHINNDLASDLITKVFFCIYCILYFILNPCISQY